MYVNDKCLLGEDAFSFQVTMISPLYPPFLASFGFKENICLFEKYCQGLLKAKYFERLTNIERFARDRRSGGNGAPAGWVPAGS